MLVRVRGGRGLTGETRRDRSSLLENSNNSVLLKKQKEHFAYGHLIVNVSKKMQTINKKLHCASAMRLGI